MQLNINELFSDLNEKNITTIIKNYKFMVVGIANKYRYKFLNVELQDLIQEGNTGLHEAIFKFDVTRGVMFFTYA